MSAFSIRRVVSAGAAVLTAAALSMGAVPANASYGDYGGNGPSCKRHAPDTGRGGGDGGGRCYNPKWANDGVRDGGTPPGHRN